MTLSRLGISVSMWVRKRRYYYIVFFIILSLLVLEGARVFILSGIENEWEVIRDERAIKEAQIIQSAFEKIQDRVHRIATRTAVLIADTECNLSPVVCFSILSKVNIDELQGIELYDRRGELIAWWGRVPAEGVQMVEINDSYTTVMQGAVFTTISVVEPIRDIDGDIQAVVVAYEAFDVQYSLSPRFIRMQGLQHDLREALGKPVQLQFGDDRYETDELQVPLYGVDKSLLGVAIFSPPTLEGYMAEVEGTIHIVRSFLIIVLSVFLIAGTIRWLRNKQFPFFALLISLIFLWGIRYLWMVFDIPGAVIGGPPFDPAYYASPHGGGIVASPGDLLLTALFLIFTGLLLFHSIVINNSLGIPKKLTGARKIWTVLVSSIVMVLYMGLVRSYAASVRSLVFDSSVRFTEPASLLPSPMLALMQFNLLLLTAAFVLLGTVLGYIALRFVQAGFHRSLLQSSGILLLIILVAAICYYFPQSNPLVPLWYYFSVPIVLITISLLVQMGFLQSFRLYKIRSVLFLTGVSVVFAAPVLDRKIHEFDREQIQFIANNIIRPTDAWKEFILHQSLQEFSTDAELVKLLGEDDHEAIRQKAFHLWAGSMLGREGYNTTIFIYDRNDNPITRFGIGFQPPDDGVLQQFIDERMYEETMIRDVETIYGNATLYAAQAPIFDNDGEQAGTIIVNVMTGPGTLFRGHGPDILRTQISPDIAARYGQLIISEFKGEQLVSTSALNLPSTHTIPETVLEALREDEQEFIWHRERINNQMFDTAYFHDTGDTPDAYLAISVSYLDFRWHIFYALKLVFFALAVSSVLLLGAGVIFYAQGKRYQPTFKEKILIGLLSLSLIPIIIVAYLNRDFTIDRMTENISQQLYEEAKRVSLQIQRYDQFGESTDPSVISQLVAERIAGELAIDFIVYVDGYMNVTSRMEMFEAELMDKRLSGFAYSSIVLEGKNFVTREEAIGQSSYLVGYMPLANEDGNLTSVIAVPAIYRQTEIDEELARRDAFLFGIYALVMLGVIITGLVVANKVSKPIEELTDATQKVAGGELDIHLPSKGESEISNLMRSFNVMTRRLKESREELARVERELAWREMARQVAHEIKNPLTPMKLSIQQLREARKDKWQDFDKSFDVITRMLLEQIDTLDRIASEFSRFARMPEAHYVPVNVNDVLQRALNIFPDKNGIDFHTIFDDTIPTIIADPEELQRAFVNIFRNSIQAMPDGGALKVVTELKNRSINITITDDGTGIPPEVRSRLFEPNFSTKTDGMGLGLAIVKKTIEELNGTIKIISEEQAGTTVSITLPIRT